ncbi:MAG TPA: hypothetical protein VIZ44_08815, partial [Gaiellaceae bacterium]
LGVVFVVRVVFVVSGVRAGSRRLFVGRFCPGFRLVAPMVVILRARTLILRTGFARRGRSASVELPVAVRIPTFVW